MTDWNAWSRIVDAAQLPEHREAVQAFLAQTDLSAEIPAVLDEKFLAPRRPAEATEEQCAHLLCNLGFAALAKGSRESAAFAEACGRVANELAPGLPELALRHLFLSTKGALVVAILTAKPQWAWDTVATQCADYLDAVGQYRKTLPAEAIEGNAMAAFSFAGKALSEIEGFRAIGHYAREVATLVAAALRLEGDLPPALAARIRSTIMPGNDAGVFFREMGAEAERALRIGEESRPAEGSALESLLSSSPSSGMAVDAWRASWAAGGEAGAWIHQPDTLPRLEDIREAWALEASAAVKRGDAGAALGAADRYGGFLADTFLHDDASKDESLAALHRIFDTLGEETALMQLVRTEADILLLVARRRGGELSYVSAPRQPAGRIREAHKVWSRAHWAAYHDAAGDQNSESECATAFAGLLDAVEASLGDVLQDLLDEDVSQLILSGDDFVDIPLHAAHTGSGDERLIDRVAVSWVPSLNVMRSCTRSKSVAAARRTGLGLAWLADAGSPADDIAALALALDANPSRLEPPLDESFLKIAAACQVFHLDTQLEHNARLPLESVLRVGEHGVSLAEIIANLDLLQCEIVSSLACESVLLSMLRAPGLDLASIFLAAGARSVLASSWAIPDGVASAMTQAFFAGWVAGQAPAAAFRLALRDLRAGSSSLPDYQWAGMRLVGAP